MRRFGWKGVLLGFGVLLESCLIWISHQVQIEMRHTHQAKTGSESEHAETDRVKRTN